jgi:hypothetical protein
MSHQYCNHSYGYCAIETAENMNDKEWAAVKKWAEERKAAMLAFDAEFLPNRQV